MGAIELLSPARDLAVGKAAIDNGADAVYIGAPAFGARRAAANSLRDIAELVEYAHRYYCRVFITFNTILYDNELPEAERLLRELYRIGVDALIVQDMGILRMDLPPFCLHASTQMHNYDMERIRFLDRLGFQRIVLARELSLEQIRDIRREVKAELEVFVHGALCVSLSGQCYLSQHLFGRSANRGECAQPCRMKWSVRDADGKVLVDDRYILSLKDLNLSAHLNDLVQAGVDSFKIEGRLKDAGYVANVTNYYAELLNGLSGVERVSSGRAITIFLSDPERSFNRGSSSYFFAGRQPGLVNPDTPKSMGKPIGTALQAKGNRLRVEAAEPLHNGDGLCYFLRGELRGIRVNNVQDGWLVCNETLDIQPGTRLFRNYDHDFVRQLEKGKSLRKIGIRMEASAEGGHLRLDVQDEDGNRAQVISGDAFPPAGNPSQRERLCAQLMKCGDTPYLCSGVDYREGETLFVPAAAANALRRKLLEELDRVRAANRPVLSPMVENPGIPYPLPVDWRLNVSNRKAADFYRDHGVASPVPAFELKPAPGVHELMRTRYCILYELGRCRRDHKNADIRFPLYLCNAKHAFPLGFDCKECFMCILDKE